MAPIDDSMPARISSDCPDEIRHMLYHAWAHDLPSLKQILNERSQASVQDPKTGETPLHAAIRACGPAAESQDDNNNNNDDGDDGPVEEAKETLQELFLSGAIWNDVDSNNETPGCVARRLGRTSLYEMCVDAGIRAEMLFAIMDEYEELESLASDNDAQEATAQEDSATTTATDQPMDIDCPQLVSTNQDNDTTSKNAGKNTSTFVPPEIDEKPVTSVDYLSSTLTYDDDKLVDSDLNGVMMAWETDIMKRSVAALLPPPSSTSDAPNTGKRILNIGFGMGIIDGMFANLSPSKHHIIEAHPSVLKHIADGGTSFGAEWEKSGPEEGAYKVHAGRWQDVLPELLEAGETYDAIYFDTFGEDYAQLKMFFTEYVLGLLDQEGRFSFFNGLGADRRICYDVYTKVVEMHAEEAGFDIMWEESDVDMSALAEAGKGEWEGVRRRYWTLDKYRLPIFTLMG